MQKCWKTTFRKIFSVNRHWAIHSFIRQFSVFRWTCSQRSARCFWVKICFTELSQNSYVKLFVLLMPDVAIWHYQHSNAIISWLRSKKYTRRIFRYPLMPFFTWPDCGISDTINKSERYKNDLWLDSFHQQHHRSFFFLIIASTLSKTMHSFIAFPWRLKS